MPMDFPDMQSLKEAAELHQFRQPNEDETEPQFRRALADHVSKIDFIESMEIRTGKGWDRFSTADSMEMLLRSGKRR